MRRSMREVRSTSWKMAWSWRWMNGLTASCPVLSFQLVFEGLKFGGGSRIYFRIYFQISSVLVSEEDLFENMPCLIDANCLERPRHLLFGWLGTSFSWHWICCWQRSPSSLCAVQIDAKFRVGATHWVRFWDSVAILRPVSPWNNPRYSFNSLWHAWTSLGCHVDWKLKLLFLVILSQSLAW